MGLNTAAGCFFPTFNKYFNLVVDLARVTNVKLFRKQSTQSNTLDSYRWEEEDVIVKNTCV